MRVSGNNTHVETPHVAFLGDVTVAETAKGAAEVTVNLPATLVGTTAQVIPATPTAAQIATALIAAFPNIFTQGV